MFNYSLYILIYRNILFNAIVTRMNNYINIIISKLIGTLGCDLSGKYFHERQTDGQERRVRQADGQGRCVRQADGQRRCVRQTDGPNN